MALKLRARVDLIGNHGAIKEGETFYDTDVEPEKLDNWMNQDLHDPPLCDVIGQEELDDLDEDEPPPPPRRRQPVAPAVRKAHKAGPPARTTHEADTGRPSDALTGSPSGATGKQGGLADPDGGVHHPTDKPATGPGHAAGDKAGKK